MQAYIIGLSINENLKLEKGKEKEEQRQSKQGSFMWSSSHITAKFCQVLPPSSAVFCQCRNIITRYAKKKYNINYYVSKFKDYLSQIIYSSISYRNKGPLVIFKKDQLIKLRYKKKIINSNVYYMYICPNIKAFAQELQQTL